MKIMCAAIVALGVMTALAADPPAPPVTLEQGRTHWELRSGERVVWRLNFGPEYAKPCLHPLAFADGREATAMRPADHRWHTGLWFSWKYLNGVNYWEEDPKTGKAEGLTEVTAVQVRRRDRQVTVDMGLAYHKPDERPVLTEQRTLVMRDPDVRGDLVIDWTSVFTVRVPELKFDRTPPARQPGGKGHGGYAGLSIRLNPALKKQGAFRADEGGPGAAKLFGARARWMDFSGPEHSDGAGVAIMDHPSNPRHPTCWYPNQDYPFFSPALLFDEPLTLKEGQTFTLRYRLWVHNAAVTPEALNAAWRAFVAETEKPASPAP